MATKQSRISAQLKEDPSYLSSLIEEKVKNNFKVYHVRDVNDITSEMLPIGMYASYIKLDMNYVGGGIIQSVNLDKKFLRVKPMNNNKVFSVQFSSVLYLFVKKDENEKVEKKETQSVEKKETKSVEKKSVEKKPAEKKGKIRKVKAPVKEVKTVVKENVKEDNKINEVPVVKRGRGRPRKVVVEKCIKEEIEKVIEKEVIEKMNKTKEYDELLKLSIEMNKNHEEFERRMNALRLCK